MTAPATSTTPASLAATPIATPRLSLPGEDAVPAVQIQMAADPGTSIWDTVVRFPDGFELAIDRWPVYDPKSRIAVPPQRLRLEGWIGGTKMFSATVNLVGGTKVTPR